MARNRMKSPTQPASAPERIAMKPRKAVLRGKEVKEDPGNTSGNKVIGFLLDDEFKDEFKEDKRKVRALLKERRMRILEKEKRNMEDPTLAPPADLPVVRQRARTKEGYYIYTPEELKMGLPGSGMTDKCPFDCDCCF